MKTTYTLAILLAFAFCLLISSCYLFTKPLDREVRVSFNTDFPVKLDALTQGATVNNFKEEDYREQFIKSFTSTLVSDKMLIDQSNPEYVITIKGLELGESVRYDTVKDKSSVDYGKVFELTSGTVTASGEVKQVSGMKSDNWDAYHSKSEKIKTNETFGQVIAGDKNETKVSREKKFPKEKFLNMTSTCASKGGSKVTKAVKRMIK